MVLKTPTLPFIISSILIPLIVFNIYSPNKTIHLTYPSKNLYDFSQTHNTTIFVKADLIAKTSSPPLPLMVISHGSLNWHPHHNNYINMLLANDINVLKLYPFDSRNQQITAGSQLYVTHQQIISDAIAGVNWVLKHYPETVIPSKIGFMGTSLGGAAALYSGWNIGLLEKIFDMKFNFALHLALYPPCFAYPKSGNWTKSKIVVMIGVDDMWTPAKACTKLFSNIYADGGPVNKKLYLYENEHHSFDSEKQLYILENVYNFDNCEFHMHDDGTTFYDMGDMNVPLDCPENRLIIFGDCAYKQNIYVGHNKVKGWAFRTVKEEILEVMGW